MTSPTTHTEPVNINDERTVRLEKLKQFEALGVQTHPERFEKTHRVEDILRESPLDAIRTNEDVQADPKPAFRTAGRIIALRRHGKMMFIDIQDETDTLQLCLFQSVLGDAAYQPFFDLLDLGDFIGVFGEPATTRQGKLALVVTEVTLLGKALRPLAGKFHGLEDTEKKYRQRYLDTIASPEALQRFKTRSKLTQAIRNWFVNEGFLEIATRTLQPQAGGAVAKPFITHHHSLDQDFALRIAPELDLKMAIVAGFDRVFEIATNFRNEGIDPSHLQEFQSIEWYAAYENAAHNMEWTEAVLKTSIAEALGTSTFTVYDRQGTAHEIDIAQSFRRVTFTDLLAEHEVNIFASKEELAVIAKKIGLPEEEIAVRSRGNLLDDIYKKLVRPNLIQPTFITQYPADLLPLARANDADPRLADSYQVVIATWEIVKGYSELVDPIRQRAMFEEQAREKAAGDEEAMSVDEEYLAAMEHGMPPITGCAIGIDRLITLITGQKNLRDCVLFPLMKPDETYEYI
jgi:lysyl-tRNA synthetase class 2